jgi:hypothetical protein
VKVRRGVDSERTALQRCCVLLVLIGLVVTRVVEKGPSASAEPGAARLSQALASATDMPAGWSPYVPQLADIFRRTNGVCGDTSPALDPAAKSVHASFAANNATGPVFGERIDQHTNATALAIMRRNEQRPYPCKWDDAGYHWTARTVPEPRRSGLFAYLQTKKPGTFTYSYEYLARRGGVVIALVTSCTTPCRVLGDRLARRALRRYDATMITTA